MFGSGARQVYDFDGNARWGAESLPPVSSRKPGPLRLSGSGTGSNSQVGSMRTLSSPVTGRSSNRPARLKGSPLHIRRSLGDRVHVTGGQVFEHLLQSRRPRNLHSRNGPLAVQAE